MAGYDTLDDAAAAAFKSLSKEERADKQEYIGILYQDPKTGKYMFTPPQTKGRKEVVGGAFQVPKGSARGIYHNHPDIHTKRGDRFSDEDVRTANASGLQSYVDHKDSMYRYDPSTNRKPMRTGTKGKQVLAQIPLDQLPKRRQQQPAGILAGL